MADRSFLKWPFLEDQHRVLAAELDAWCVANLPVDHNNVDAACCDLVSRLGADGWLQHSANLDRPALDVRALCLIRETLARHDPLADFAFAMQGLGMGPVSLFGDDYHRKWLSRTTKGTAIAGFALSEPASGSDVANLATTAASDGDGWVVNGEKTWISNGGIADQYVLFARTGDAPGAKGLSAFVVEADTPGFSISERINVIAPHPLATITFDNCRIPTTAMLGDSGDGFKVAMATLDVFRTSVGGASLGFARRAMDEAIERSKARQAFGKPISDFQLIQAKIADMAVKVDAMALLIYRPAWVKDVQDIRVTSESSMAKLYGTEAAQEVIDQAVQIFGGMGVVSGVPVERLYREIRALRIYEGTSEIQKLVIAGQAIAASTG